MKVVTFSSGTLVSAFPLGAFTPLGMVNECEIVAAIGQRHGFGTTPEVSSYAELESGLAYELGFLATEWGEISVHRLAVCNDGVVIRTNETGYSEALFDDLTKWLVASYGCRETEFQSFFLSEMVVEFEKPAANVFAKYNKIVDIILPKVNVHRDASAAAFNTLSIEFVSKSPSVPKFIIERHAGTPVDGECYFCSAPLAMDHHLEVLQEIKRLLP